jgi:hypothetical protein
VIFYTERLCPTNAFCPQIRAATRKFIPAFI